tara:strand:+ start:560 stop:985 length:426 start_codon:yes stop_codon:yes gene_type:complete
MGQSKRSRIRTQRKTISKPTKRNNRSRRRVMIKKTKMDYNDYKNQIDAHIELRQFALQKGNLEVYAYSNKIILVLLLQLVAHGTKKAVKLANEYSEKTGVEIDESKLDERISRIPTVKNTVGEIQASFNAPASVAALGWEW